MNPDNLRMLVDENDKKGRQRSGPNQNSRHLSILVVLQFLSIVFSHRNEEGSC